MKMASVLIAALLVIASLGVVYAAPPVPSPKETMPVMVKAQAGVEGNAPGPGPVARQLRISPQVRKHLERILQERLGPNVDVKKIVEQAVAARERAVRAAKVSRDMIRRWENISKHYLHAVQKIRETARKYEEKRMLWIRARERFQRGEISEEEYFSAAKDMVLSAIDAAIERLEAIKQNVEDTAEIDNAIARLQELRAEVEAAPDLDALRTIYKDEVVPAIREYHDRLFFRYYVRGTIHAAQSIVSRLDVAAARLASYVERAKALGVYDDEMDARVTAIFAKIETIKAELNALEIEVEGKDVTPKEYIAKLNALKRDVVEVYWDIRDLIRDYARKLAVKVRTRIRERKELNAPEERPTVRTEAEVEGNVSADEAEISAETNVTVEENTVAEVNISSETTVAGENTVTETEINVETDTTTVVPEGVNV